MKLILIKKLLQKNNLVRSKLNILNFYKNNNHSLKNSESFIILPLGGLSSIKINTLRLLLSKSGFFSYQVRNNFVLNNLFIMNLKLIYLGQLLIIPLSVSTLSDCLNLLEKTTDINKIHIILKDKKNYIIKTFKEIEEILINFKKISIDLEKLKTSVISPILSLNNILLFPSILKLLSILKLHAKNK